MSHRWTVRLGASSLSDLECGLLGLDGATLLRAPCQQVMTLDDRAGVDARVAAALEAQRTQRLLYMSCDAATLARDVSRLPAYRVESLRAYDMFPQTAHVEVVCSLVPEGT